VRLLEGLNQPLRSMTQCRGDLSQMVMEAIDQVNLVEASLVDISAAAKANETCVMLSESARRTVKKAAKQRAASLNALVSTAVAHWLAGKKAITLKS
jgi:hypothetical protein